MTDRPISPTSLAGIKRLAKSFRRQGLPHAKALDAASRAASFSNFTHARRSLASSGVASPTRGKTSIWITAYWRDPKTYASGRETLRIVLEHPWAELIGARQLVHLRYLGEFRGQSEDHFVCKTLQDRVDRSRSLICGAARELQFMSATHLRPTGNFRKAYPKTDRADRLPYEDHSSIWVNQSRQVHVIVDEPYDTALDRDVGTRDAWAARHGYQITRSSWPGMYYPEGGSQMFLVGPRVDVPQHQEWLAQLGKLPSPPSSENWQGESGPYRPLLLSPSEAAAGMKARAPKDPLAARANALTRPYIQTFVGPSRRPNARMPIEAHEEVGRLLREVLVDASERAGVNSRLNYILGELDEWVMREFARDELTDERFFGIYTVGFRKTYASSIADEVKGAHLNRMQRVESILKGYYPMSPPLRQLLAKLDAAKKSLASWRQVPRRRTALPQAPRGATARAN